MSSDNNKSSDFTTIAILIAFQVVIPKAIYYYGQSIDKVAKYFNLGNSQNLLNDKKLIPNSDNTIKLSDSELNIKELTLISENLENLSME